MVIFGDDKLFLVLSHRESLHSVCDLSSESVCEITVGHRTFLDKTICWGIFTFVRKRCLDEALVI